MPARQRGVSTARTVLRALSLLAGAHEQGLRASAVADALGKSTSTTYSLLDTLVQEGFVVHDAGGTYHLTGAARELIPAARGDGAQRLPSGIADVLDELFERTRKRVYLAAARSGQVVIPLVRGRQGMPRIPGLGSQIGANAHALALGKIALSLLDERALTRYLRHGLKAYTPTTITDPQVAAAPARGHPGRRGRVRRRGVQPRLLLPGPARAQRGRPSRGRARRLDVRALLRARARPPVRRARRRRRAGLARSHGTGESSDFGRPSRS